MKKLIFFVATLFVLITEESFSQTLVCGNSTTNGTFGLHPPASFCLSKCNRGWMYNPNDPNAGPLDWNVGISPSSAGSITSISVPGSGHNANTYYYTITWNSGYTGSAVFRMNEYKFGGDWGNRELIAVHEAYFCRQGTGQIAVSIGAPNGFSVIAGNNINLNINNNTGCLGLPEISWFVKNTGAPDNTYQQLTAFNNNSNLSYATSSSDLSGKTFKATVKSSCNTYYNLNPVDIVILPTCVNNNIATINTSSISGPGLQIVEGGYPSGGYRIQDGQTYTLNINGITDLFTNYNITSNDPSLVITGNTFVLNSDIGSYRIEINKKPGREACPAVSPFKVFVAGSDVTFTEPCLVVLPDYFLTPPPKIPGAVNGNDIIFRHFSVTVRSQVGVIVKPGVTLTDGAELQIQTIPSGPDPSEPDNQKNYAHEIAYDDYGNVIMESRHYFDNTGKLVQDQVKNLASGVVLATETLYDQYGRASIKTLPAPVRARTITTIINECGDQVQVGQDLYFLYKDDFVTNTGGTKYTPANFDGVKENAPDPVGNSMEGTLGWYYSNNNNASSSSLLKEPYVPASGYPYSRTAFYNDGSGEVKSTTLPGDQHKMGGGHVASIQKTFVTSSDPVIAAYLNVRNTHVFPNDANQPSNMADRAYKILNTDTEGNQVISYFDNSDQLIVNQHVASATVSYNFYDDAGRLVVGITPNGVVQLNTGSLYSAIDKTIYKYNHQGWLLETSGIDAGTTKYMYRKDGTLRFSQNSEQFLAGAFSYINYDKTGRAIETGIFTPCISCSLTFGSDFLKLLTEYTGLNDGLTVSLGTKSDVILTSYDVADPASPIPQEFLIGKVSFTTKDDGSQTWFSYDERGRVVHYAQDIPGLGVKRIEYTYNEGGNVSKVAYQKGVSGDEFYHHYTFDASQRLKETYTSLTEAGTQTLQAKYFYYLHGPVKRVEIADNLQGIDYVYTIQGWLKSINHFDKTKDPGQDAMDAFGMTLEYFSGDYVKSGTNISSMTVNNYANHYNGIIKAVGWNSEKPGGIGSGTYPDAYAYEYDNKYQLTAGRCGVVYNNQFFKYGVNALTEDNLTYDKNGNLETLRRYDGMGGTAMHDFTDYQYYGNSNMLQTITGYGKTYTYDAIGRIKTITDASGTTHIRFNGNNQIVSVSEDAAGAQPLVKFFYDISASRYKKESYSPSNVLQYSTFYVRDFSGKIMAVYDNNNTSGGVQVKKEVPIYATERIGVYYAPQATYQYEMSDHQGNVRVTFTRTNNQLTIEGYSDYYPYGAISQSMQPANSYRFGYQGQFAEYDPETNFDGDGGWSTFDLRMYDPIIGRWMSIDPAGQYASPYVGMGNNPINGVDEDGAFFEEFKNWIIGRGWVTNSAHHFMQQWGGTAKAINNNVTEVTFQDYDDASGTWITTTQLFASKGRNVIKFHHAYVFESKHGPKNGYWGITLPPTGIVVSNGQLDNTDLITHEYGHWLQYMEVGSALKFYLKYGIPSFINQIGFGINHHYYWIEIDANRRASATLGHTFPTNYGYESHGSFLLVYPVNYNTYPWRPSRHQRKNSTKIWNNGSFTQYKYTR